MIFHCGSSSFAPFSTILGPDPTVPPTKNGSSTVAPLREIHAHTHCVAAIYCMHVPDYLITVVQDPVYYVIAVLYLCVTSFALGLIIGVIWSVVL